MKKFGLVFGLTLLFGVSSFAQNVYVDEVQGEGIDSTARSTVRQLVSGAVNEVPGYHVNTDKKEIVLRPHLLKLGSSYILKIDKLKENKVLYSANMKSATLDDVDLVAVRVVKSVLLEESIESTATTQTITKDEETKGTARYQATRQWRFSFGPAWSRNLKAGTGTVWGLGYVWGLDPYWDLRLMISGFSSRDSNASDASFGGISIGVNKFFDLQKHSPYLAAAIFNGSATASDGQSTSFIDTSDDDARGWGLTAGVGYKMFRTSTVNFGLELTHSILFDKTKISNASPQMTMLEIVVYY